MHRFIVHGTNTSKLEIMNLINIMQLFFQAGATKQGKGEGFLESKGLFLFEPV